MSVLSWTLRNLFIRMYSATILSKIQNGSQLDQKDAAVIAISWRGFAGMLCYRGKTDQTRDWLASVQESLAEQAAGATELLARCTEMQQQAAAGRVSLVQASLQLRLPRLVRTMYNLPFTVVPAHGTTLQQSCRD